MQNAPRECKLRLLMIVAAIHPDKFEGEKGQYLMKVGLVSSVLISLFYAFSTVFVAKMFSCLSVGKAA